MFVKYVFCLTLCLIYIYIYIYIDNVVNFIQNLKKSKFKIFIIVLLVSFALAYLIYDEDLSKIKDRLLSIISLNSVVLWVKKVILDKEELTGNFTINGFKEEIISLNLEFKNKNNKIVTLTNKNPVIVLFTDGRQEFFKKIIRMYIIRNNDQIGEQENEIIIPPKDKIKIKLEISSGNNTIDISKIKGIKITSQSGNSFYIVKNYKRKRRKI